MTETVWGTSQHVRVSGVGLHVESAGTGPTVALLHGFASGTFSWAGLAPLLIDNGFHVIAWDRPPFGASERPAVPTSEPDPYRAEAEVERTQAVLAGHDRPVLVGHSAGTLAAVQAVHAGVVHPRALVLMAPALDGRPPALVRRTARLPGVGAAGRTALRLALPRADLLLRRMSAHPTPLQRATAEATARSLARRGTAEALWHLTATWSPPDVDVDALVEHDIPTLVIGGRDDRISPPESTMALADAVGAELVLLNDVGHAPQEQVPRMVHDAVVDFLARLP